MAKRIVVVAGNYMQYERWVLATDYVPNDCIYAANPETILGLHDFEYVLVGTFKMHPHWQRVLEIIDSYGGKLLT